MIAFQEYCDQESIRRSPSQGLRAERRGASADGFTDHAKSVAERIAAKRGWPGALRSVLVLDRPALCAHLVQHPIEILDVQVEVDRRPVSLVAAPLRARRGALAARLLGVHAHAHVVGVEYGHGRKRASRFHEAEDVAVEA